MYIQSCCLTTSFDGNKSNFDFFSRMKKLTKIFVSAAEFEECYNFLLKDLAMLIMLVWTGWYSAFLSLSLWSRKKIFFSDCIDTENLFARLFRYNDTYVYQSTRGRNTEDLSTHSKPVTLTITCLDPSHKHKFTLPSFKKSRLLKKNFAISNNVHQLWSELAALVTPWPLSSIILTLISTVITLAILCGNGTFTGRLTELGVRDIGLRRRYSNWEAPAALGICAYFSTRLRTMNNLFK